jgi:DNA-binding MarR family transcriptional regulator
MKLVWPVGNMTNTLLTTVPEPFGAQAETLVALLARANHVLCQAFEERLKLHGFSLIDWRVLTALARSDGMAMAELANVIMLKHPTLTKRIDRMEQAELVRRRTPTTDRRRALVYLTDRGRKAAAPLVIVAAQYEALLHDALGAATDRRLKAMLATLIDLVLCPEISPLSRTNGSPAP